MQSAWKRVPRILASILVFIVFLSGCLNSTSSGGSAQTSIDSSASESTPAPADISGALSTMLQPKQTPEYYVEQGNKYFDTLATFTDPRSMPNYSALVARWEWLPWLKLTGYTRDNMIWSDIMLKFYPTSVPVRECRAFSVNPFCRCHVKFSYLGTPCYIYEEFTFNDQGEMTFIEAWSDNAAYLPMDATTDYWAEGAGVRRLSTRVPGLGNATGLIDPGSQAMADAAAKDEDVADFLKRAKDPGKYWFMELDRYNKSGCNGECGNPPPQPQ